MHDSCFFALLPIYPTGRERRKGEEGEAGRERERMTETNKLQAWWFQKSRTRLSIHVLYDVRYLRRKKKNGSEKIVNLAFYYYLSFTQLFLFSFILFTGLSL